MARINNIPILLKIAEEERQIQRSVANFRRALRRAEREVRRGPPPTLPPGQEPEPGSYAATQPDAAEWLAVNQLMVEYGYITAECAEGQRLSLFRGPPPPSPPPEPRTLAQLEEDARALEGIIALWDEMAAEAKADRLAAAVARHQAAAEAVRAGVEGAEAELEAASAELAVAEA